MGSRCGSCRYRPGSFSPPSRRPTATRSCRRGRRARRYRGRRAARLGRWVGRRGDIIGLHRFGASAPYTDIYKHLNFTPEYVAQRAREAARARQGIRKGRRHAYRHRLRPRRVRPQANSAQPARGRTRPHLPRPGYRCRCAARRLSRLRSGRRRSGRERRRRSGIVVCGSGAGACIAASKVFGARAFFAGETYTAHQAVEHDDANVLCLGERVTGPELAVEIARTFVRASSATRSAIVDASARSARSKRSITSRRRACCVRARASGWTTSRAA